MRKKQVWIVSGILLLLYLYNNKQLSSILFGKRNFRIHTPTLTIEWVDKVINQLVENK